MVTNATSPAVIAPEKPQVSATEGKRKGRPKKETVDTADE